MTVLTYLDPEYPAPLRTIPDPPPLLYLQGTLQENDRQAVAIVGTRKVSAAGRVLAEELAHELAALGFTIVSGLARGVDAAAHRGAMRSLCGPQLLGVLCDRFLKDRDYGNAATVTPAHDSAS